MTVESATTETAPEERAGVCVQHYFTCDRPTAPGIPFCGRCLGMLQELIFKQSWTGRLNPAQLLDAELTAVALVDAQRRDDGEAFHALLPGDLAEAIGLIIGMSAVGAMLVNAIDADSPRVVGWLREQVLAHAEDDARAAEQDGAEDD